MKSRLKILQFIRDDFFYKLFAFALATIVWIFVNQQIRSESAVFTVPVAVSYDEERMVVEPSSFTVQVVVRGSRSGLDRLSGQEIQIEPAIPVVEPGIDTYELRLAPGQVRTPSGIQVEGLRPASVSLRVDRRIEKTVPVRIREQGTLPVGYQVQERRVVPATARLTGPSRLLVDIDQAATEPIMLGETTTQTFEQDNVRLQVPGRVEVSPRSVHVSYEISRHTATESFNRLPVRVLTAAGAGLRVVSELPEASVTVRGPRAVVAAMQAHQLQVFVDLSEITSPGQYSRPVRVWLPDGRVSLEYVQPAELEVELAMPPAASRLPEPPAVSPAVPESAAAPAPGQDE